jgi:hypothetical protein
MLRTLKMHSSQQPLAQSVRMVCCSPGLVDPDSRPSYLIVADAGPLPKPLTKSQGRESIYAQPEQAPVGI